MLCLAESSTPTTTGMTAIFDKKNLYYLGLSVAWSLKTCISLHLKSMALSKPFFPFFPAKVAAFMWTATTMTKRMMNLVFYFAPSLGLFNLLNHWKWEQIQFTVRKHRNVTPDDQFVLRNIDPMPWTDLDRWNYYDDPANPTPPSYVLYTGFNIGQYFGLFWLTLFLHTGTNILLKLLTSQKFRTEASTLDKFIHCLENCNIPSPWKDWDEDSVTVEDHITQFKSVMWEMFGTILINFIFGVIMMLPLSFTGDFKLKQPQHIDAKILQ